MGHAAIAPPGPIHFSPIPPCFWYHHFPPIPARGRGCPTAKKWWRKEEKKQQQQMTVERKGKTCWGNPSSRRWRMDGSGAWRRGTRSPPTPRTRTLRASTAASASSTPPWPVANLLSTCFTKTLNLGQSLQIVHVYVCISEKLAKLIYMCVCVSMHFRAFMYLCTNLHLYCHAQGARCIVSR